MKALILTMNISTEISTSHYPVIAATTPDQALELLKTKNISAILVKDNLDLLKQAHALKPEVPGILLSDDNGEAITTALRSGLIYQRLSTQAAPIDVESALDRAVERLQLSQEVRTLDQAKKDFMLLINHELKTPLTGISSFLQLLQETALSTEQELFTHRISQNTERLQSLINDVLELMSAEIGETTVLPEQFNAKDVLRKVRDKFTDQAKLKNVEFIEEGDGTLNADRPLVEKILRRLIDNAVKFSPEKNTVTLRSRQLGDRVRVEIENLGQSLDPVTIKKILKPFTLNENAMNHTRGTGVGLSLVQALLKRHQSKLNIETEDQLVRISFDLPSGNQ